MKSEPWLERLSIHFLPENLGPYWYFDLNHCLSVWSTDCCRALSSRLSSLRSLANAFPKRWRPSWRSWGSTVQVYVSPQGVRVPPFKGKKVLRIWMLGNPEKCIFEVPNRETLCVPLPLAEEGVWVWHQWVNRDDRLIHYCWVLHQLILPGRHLDRKDWGVAGGLAGSDESCFRNLLSSSWIPLRASGFRGHCLFQGCFPQALNLIFYWGSTFCPSWHWGYPRLQDLLVLKFLKGCCGGYFDAHQVDHLGLLTYAFSVWILYLLGLHPVLGLCSRSQPSRGTGHSGRYRKEWVVTIDPTLQARGDVNHLTFSWPSQNRAGISTAHSKLFSCLPHRRCPEALWSNEDGSGGTWNRPGTWACHLGHGDRSQGTGASQGHPSGVPQEGAQDIPLPVPPFLTKGVTGSGGFLVVCPALHGPLEVVGESEPPKAVFSVLASYLGWPPPLSLSCYRPL